MNRTTTTSWLDALSPAQKMELADRLYDLAIQELDAAGNSIPSKEGRGARDHRPTEERAEVGYLIEPWQGFCDRLTHR